MKDITLNKLSGIYQITNIINNKVYIGHSTHITFRWHTHLDNLIKNIHHNFKLQDDFNTYGLLAFNFKILELLEGKENLIKREQEYLNKIDFDSNYNIYNSKISVLKHNILDFLEYIESKWVISDIHKDLEKYRIYKKEDRDEILNKAIECNIFNLCKSHITFNRVMKYIENCFGFSIIDKRKRKKQKIQYRYKLIINLDLNK